MSLAAALEHERLAKIVRVPCSVSVALDALGPDDRPLLEAALRSDMSHVGIARALKSTEGVTHVASQGAIARHRNGDCACEPR